MFENFPRKNWEKLGKVGKYWGKLGKIGKTLGKLGKVGENTGKTGKTVFPIFPRKHDFEISKENRTYLCRSLEVACLRARVMTGSSSGTFESTTGP